MGDRQCEGIVEDSIIFLDDRFPVGEADVRSCIAALYAFQKRYDTSDTYFHILERLLKHRYLYVFNMDEHPEYERYRAVFQAFRGWCSVYRDPAKEGGEENPEIGFYVNPSEEWGRSHADKSYRPELRGGRLYCVAGSELWAAFVKHGKLTGRDAEPPVELPLQRVVAMIAQKALEQNEPYLVRVWLPTLAFDLAEVAGREALAADPDVQAFRRIAKKMDVLSMRGEDVNSGGFELPVDYWLGYRHEETVNWFVALDDV
ncbi:MAG: hypothetical protein ACMG6S_02630 [Byssovorax sp.]